MIKLFFDIETLPSADEHKEAHLEILRKKNKAGKTDEEIHGDTSFEGTFGRICCIAIIKEDENGIIQKEIFSGDEKEILENFWKAANGVHRYVGHNIWGFDLPFIYKRSVILGVRPLPLNFARYRNIPIYDTMTEWDLWNYGKSQKLDTLAKVLGLPTSKDEMDGSMVADYFKQGRIDEICKYCMKDVELTRKVYYKMVFEEMPQENE
jgi:predicted PolB exonuclease-like 3'-5' exonuclease